MKKRTAWLLCLVWMAVIFVMSATPADISSEESGAVMRVIVGVIQAVSRDAVIDPDLMEIAVRKTAHMLEFAVLFLLYRRALRLSGVEHAAWAALLLCALYAATDEFHQLFVPDRAGRPLDVLIDTGGALLAWGAEAGVNALRARLTHRGA